MRALTFGSPQTNQQPSDCRATPFLRRKLCVAIEPAVLRQQRARPRTVVLNMREEVEEFLIDCDLELSQSSLHDVLNVLVADRPGQVSQYVAAAIHDSRPGSHGISAKQADGKHLGVGWQKLL